MDRKIGRENSRYVTFPVSIIYGHETKNGTMFGTLLNYKKQAYYDEHPVLYLYTPEKVYRLVLTAGVVVDAKSPYYDVEEYGKDPGALVSSVRERSAFASEREWKEGERVVLLSTCTYEFDNARYLLVGILEEMALR